MQTRRSFLARMGIGAGLGVMPVSGWAEARSPRFLAAARVAGGSYRLFGLSAGMKPVFSVALPGRGHAAAAHPFRPEAIAFARRPGVFGVVIDCVTGRPRASLTAPAGRHFYGHGVFSEDGETLFTTENVYDEGVGAIGVWDATRGYRRVGEFHSNGVGPHDIQRIPGSGLLVVANGGIDTHPDTGREKLNLPTMRSNISFLSAAGEVVAVRTLSPEYRLNSIRHLAVSPNGRVAFGCQWQGDITQTPPLVGHCSLSGQAQLEEAKIWASPSLEGYIGSVAISDDAQVIAATAPRGNLAIRCRVGVRTGLSVHHIPDVSGVATSGRSFCFTSGVGHAGLIGEPRKAWSTGPTWDNHLVRL